ncbi:MAG: DUF350 domain-containing protein [Rhodopila sp.]
MSSDSPSMITSILEAVGSGLPHLLLQFLLTLLLLGVGIGIYTLVTPFHERALLAKGNVAAGTVLAGAVLALAIPLAALLATTFALLDILVWGIVALLIQLLTLVVVSWAMRGFGRMIEAGNVSAAITLVGVQIAIALLNAAAMVPN